ncbi:PAS domain-containing protein [Belnapia sp. T6]|uniref:histidine kinase n=1 Tax=Belnapia mucosa TaxID=2804532 RepID=A0ABS1V7Q0_9PROT|nr:PAS domain-containing protein [Belnapia mucosa]MBL6457675.1 PAS domain-containing protein [Belnapia mucosa]
MARARISSAPLSALLAAVVALPLALAGLAAWSSWTDAWREAEGEMIRAADASAEYARRVLDSHRVAADRVNDLLRDLSDDEIREREAELHARLQRLIAEEQLVQTAYVGDREGRLLLSASLYPVPREVDVADREYHSLLAVEEPPPVVLTRVYRGRIEGNTFFAVARRRTRTGNGMPPGQFDGQANVSVFPDDVAAGLRRLRAGEADVISLLRADGEVLARTAGFGPKGRPIRVGPESPMLAAMAAGEERAISRLRSTVDGVEQVVAYRRVEGWPAYAASARPRAAVVEHWRRAAVVQGALGLAAALLLAVLALLVRRGQRRLAEANARLEGRVEERTAALSQALAELRAHDQHLRLALEAVQLGSFEVDARTGIATRTGRTVPDQPNLPLQHFKVADYLAQVVHLEDVDRVRATYEAAVAGRIESYRIEYRVRRPEGGWNWTESYAGVVERDPASGEVLRIAGVARDVTERKAAEAALASSEERLRLAQEAGGIGCWEWDVAMGTLHWSESCHRLHGTDPAVPPGYAAWLALIHPEDRPEVEAALEATLLGGGESWETEFRIIRPGDGALRWIASRGRVVRDPRTGQTLRMIGIALDLTERKLAEERMLLLAREVDHRAKNALAVVQAAVRLTPKDDPVAYGQAVEGRVRALAQAHSLLAESAWAGASVRDLVRVELGAFLPSGGGAARATASGPDLMLVPPAAQALSMTLHELGTNAAKYGALSTAAGQVVITWRIEAEAGLLRLRWEERGGPVVPRVPERRGFGSRVIEAMVLRQLGGTIRRDWPASGLVCEITIPLSRAAAGGTPALQAAQ